MKHFVSDSVFLAAGICSRCANRADRIEADTGGSASTTVNNRRCIGLAGVKLPPGVPRVRGIVKTAFSLRYQDIKIGTGADAEPNKIYKVLYTGGWPRTGTSSTLRKTIASRSADKDGKPVMGRGRQAEAGRCAADQFPAGIWPRDSRLRSGICGHEGRRQTAAFHSLAAGVWRARAPGSGSGASGDSAQGRPDFRRRAGGCDRTCRCPMNHPMAKRRVHVRDDFAAGASADECARLAPRQVRRRNRYGSPRHRRHRNAATHSGAEPSKPATPTHCRPPTATVEPK